jgi:phage gpG-like protein
MVSIRINLVEINKILERTEDIITDMSPFWDDAFDDVIVPKVKEVFETRGYGIWPPRKDNLPHPLLRKSERLFDSLTSRSHPDEVGSIS